jgi:hypothetical protein
MRQFRQRDDGEEGAVLDDLDHLVADDGPRRQQQRWKNNAAEQPDLGKAKCNSRLDRFAGLRRPRPTQNLRHVSGIINCQRREPGSPVVKPDAERGKPVIDDIGEQQERDAAHAVNEAARDGRDQPLLRHQRRRQDKAEQQRRCRRQHRQDRGIAQSAEQQVALTPHNAEIMDHAAASAMTCRRSIRRCSETRTNTIGA